MKTDEDDNGIRIANEQETAEFAPSAEEGVETAVAVENRAEATKQAAEETAALRAQVAELQDKYLRARAEVDNIARRAQQERLEAVRFGNADLLRALLPVVDDFERTLAAGGDQTGAVLEGVKLIYDKLVKLLRDSGVEPLESLGKPFNPTEHSALLQQPSADRPPGTVIQEVQRGYRYRDRVLRPAQVIVAAKETDGERGRGEDKETRRQGDRETGK